MLSKSIRPAGLLALGCLLAALSAGCGITLDAASDETELFKELTVEGDFVPGRVVTLTLDYSQQYTVAVNIVCEIVAAEAGLVPTPVTTPTHTPLPADEATPTDVPIPPPQPTTRLRVGHILQQDLPPNEEGGPVGEATPVPDTIVHEFAVPQEPGRYLVRCVTPSDQNNVITAPFTVDPLPTPTPGPEGATTE